MPSSWSTLKERVRSTQVRAARAANTELLRLYWSIGRDILDRQGHAGWAARSSTASPATCATPSPTCAASRAATCTTCVRSPRLGRRRRLCAESVCTIDLEPRHHPAHPPPGPAAAHLVRSSAVQHQLVPQRPRAPDHEPAAHPIGAAPSNFAHTLPPSDSDLAQSLTRDPYVFDHLGLTGPVSERRLEQALMDKLQAILTASGTAWLSVGPAAALPGRAGGWSSTCCVPPDHNHCATSWWS